MGEYEKLFKKALKTKTIVKLIKGKTFELKPNKNYIMTVGSNDWIPTQQDINNLRDILEETYRGFNNNITIIPSPYNSIKFVELSMISKDSMPVLKIQTVDEKISYKIKGRK